jgi:hypothetical protein
MKKLIFLLLLCFPIIAEAQYVRVGPNQISQQTTVGNVTNALTIPTGALVQFCAYPANAVPCTNLATTYTGPAGFACLLSTQIVLDGTSTCVATPDAQENWGVWVPAGNYQFTITIPGSVALGPYTVSAGGAAGGTTGGGIVNSLLTATSASTATFTVAGIPLGNGGAPVTSCAPYVVKADTTGGSATTLDRGSVVEFNSSSACAVTLPDTGSTGMGGNFVVKFRNVGAGAVTINRGTSSTFSLANGGTGSIGGTLFSLTQWQYSTCYGDNSSVWRCDSVSPIPGNLASPGPIGGTIPGPGAFTTLTATNGVVALSDGLHAQGLSLTGNTILPVIPTNTWGFIGPNTPTFTSWFIQGSSTGPSGNCVPLLGALSSSVSQFFCSSMFSVYDNAARANGGIGSNWTANKGGVNISSNTFIGSTAAVDNLVYWNANTFSPYQFAQATVVALNGASDYAGVSVLNSGSPALPNFYSCNEITTSIRIQIGEISVLTSTATTGAAGDVIRLEVSPIPNSSPPAVTLTCYQNGVQKLQSTDTSYSSGVPGLFIANTVDTLKNWSGGNLPPVAQLGTEQDWTKTQHFDAALTIGNPTVAGAPTTGAAYANSFITSGSPSVSGCSLSASVGGASAGKFASGTTGTCTVTITLPTAPTGWTCDAHDLTTAADANNVVQTAFTTTSATVAGVTVSGDVITWKCRGW